MKSELEAVVVKVTPGMAQTWLEEDNNNGNRPVSDRHVQSLARAMKEGRWVLNGKSIVIDTRGALIDGQHRLWAVMMADRTVKMLVATVPVSQRDAVFNTIDVGKRRSAADALAIGGHVHRTTLASSTVILWRYRNGVLTGKGKYPGNDEVVAMVEEFPMLIKSTEAVRSGSYKDLRAIMTGSVAAFGHYLFGTLGRTWRDLFFEGLGSGVGLEADSGVLVLRRRLISNAKAPRGKRMPQAELCALMIKAWNIEVAGRTCKALRWGAHEQFPKATRPAVEAP